MSDVTHQVRIALARPAFKLAVDLALPAKGITAIYGASGSGKTTLLRCVAGLERAARGVVKIAGRVWQDDDQSIFLPTWKRPLGYVFQEASLFDHLDVQANLEYGLKRSQTRESRNGLNAAIELLGIAGLLQRRTDQLSGGERQRVAIARALGTLPAMLLLDEPLASLDHARRQDILPWLEKLRDELNIPMLYVTHAADEVARLADTLVMLDGGVVKAAGPVSDVLASTDIPVVLGEDAGALLEATVQACDAQWRLAQVGFPGGQLWLRDDGLTIGQRVRLRVLARDVSITLQEATETSIQNHLPCVVETVVAESHPSQVLVGLRCGSTVLLARITARAVAALSLKLGQQVWAQVKSVALVK
jgi:molybdate transport system ATP-binding protein